MKKFAIAVAAVLVLLIIAAVVAPSFIDWNRYKNEISDQAEAATGRRLAIDGDISLSVLPMPTLRVEQVRLANLAGGSAPEMATLKSLDVRVALLPLLRGSIEVASVKLVEPSILLEVLADGRRNWDFQPAKAAEEAGDPSAPADGDGGSGPAVKLDEIVIENGSLVYVAGAGQPAERVERINARLRARTLAQGPFDADGQLVARGIGLAFELGIGFLDPARPVPVGATVTLVDSGARVQFNGEVADLQTAPRVSGRLRSEGGSLAAVLTAAGITAPTVLSEAYSLQAEVTASAAEAGLNDLVVRLGDATANGAVNAAFGDRLTLDATLGVNHLDLDALVRAAGEAPPRAATPPAAAPAPAEAQAADGGFALPERMGGTVNLSIAAATWRGSVVRQAQFVAELTDGAVILRRAGALLPGGSDVSASGRLVAAEGQPSFRGRVEGSSDNLRALLEWVGANVGAVPADRLRKLQFGADLAATPRQVRAEGLDLRLDASRVSGAVGYGLGERPSLGVDLTLDRLNLDAYLPAAGQPPAGQPDPQPQQPQQQQANALPPPPATAALADFDADVKLRIGQLTYNGSPIDDLSLEAALRAGTLRIAGLQVKNAAGANLTASGTVAEIATSRPRAEITARLRAERLEGPMRLAQLTLPPHILDLGGIDLATTFAGAPQDFELRDTKFSFGPLQAEGRLGVDLEGERPRLEAALTAGDILLDRLLPPSPAGSGAAPNAGGGSAAAPAGERWSREPLDLSMLTAFDADVTLSAKRIEARGYTVQEPRLAMALNGGILEIGQLTGRLFGGAAEIRGRLAAVPRPGFDMRVNLTDADLGEALATATGLNVVSGRFGLNSELRSAGLSQFEMVQNLGGALDMEARDGAIEGIDLKSLSDRLKRLNEPTDYLGLIGRSFAGGRTRLLSAGGTWVVERGVARTTDTRADLEAAAAALNGAVDLPAWMMDLHGEIRLTEHAEAPVVGIALKGPIDAPERDFKTQELETFILGKVGGGLLRGGTGERLRGLLGGGPEKAQPEASAPEQAEPGKPKIEDAVRGLLRGLGR